MRLSSVHMCCFKIVSLKQGTILISIVDLFLSSIAVFLLIFGSVDVHRMSAVLQVDIEESAHREGISLAYDNTVYDDWKIQNGMRFHEAEHLASMILIFFYIGVFITTLHLASSILLMYGVVMVRRQFMAPWLVLKLIGIALFFTLVFVSAYLMHSYKSYPILSLGMFFSVVFFHSWFVVHCHYKELLEREVGFPIMYNAPLKNHSYIKYADDVYNV